jgi:hypothetical protein
MTETGNDLGRKSPDSDGASPGNRTLAQKLGDWLARDREEKDVDLAKLMRANILISFLSLMLVAGDETAFTLWLMLGL